jgi:hypothetical protein
MRHFRLPGLTLLSAILWASLIGCTIVKETTPSPVQPTAGPEAPQASKPDIVLNSNRLTLKVGGTFQLQAKVRNSDRSVQWSSFNPGLATVNSNGLVTAIHEGALTVSATLADNTEVTADCLVEVAGDRPPAATNATPRTIKGIRIANEIDEMTVGDEIGIVGVCLPYSVFDDNPYTLETSDPQVVQAHSANIAKAVGEGRVTLTVRTPNGCKDSITVSVKAAKPDADPSPAETYQVELGKFGIVRDRADEKQSIQNSIGINTALLYAQRHGYRKVVFSAGLYVLDPLQSISMRSNLIIDLNGSTWQIRPNGYARYALIRFRELNQPNLFDSFSPAGQPAMRPSLSPRSLNKYDFAAGSTSLRSKPIPVGDLPAKDARDQTIRVLERGAPILLSCPVAVVNHATNPAVRLKIAVRFKLNYYQGKTIVASNDFGNLWISDITGQRFNTTEFEHRLRSQTDYDSVGSELLIWMDNGGAELFFDQPVICGKITTVLENCRLRNGTILGERDFKEAIFPKWKNDPKTEGALAISFEEGPNNGIESLTVKKGIGFNMASRLGQQSAGAVGVGPIPLKFTNLEFGDFDAQGGKIDSPLVQRTKEFLDLAPLHDSFELGLPLGYMGYNTLRVRVYDILFYDANKTLLERRWGRLSYRKYSKPAAARYAHVVLHWDAPITQGHPDFNNAIGFFTNYHPPIRNYIRNCIIEDNYSCGFAACGGINWRIEGNIFRRNGGRMPGCDIDWEDGWEFSQDDLIRNNSFESHSGLIVCAGLNHVFSGNTIKHNLTVYGRSQYMKFADNTFGETGKTVKASFGTLTETYICGNTFLGGPVSLSKQHGDKGMYSGLWLGNRFSDTKVSNPGARNDILTDNTFVRSSVVP